MENSTQTRYGRYKQGGTTDVTKTSLKWWERRTFQPAFDDIPVKITATYSMRPDLIAFDVYGRANLMWLVLQYNNIVDIHEDLIVGKTIYLPSQRRLQTEILIKS